MTEYRAGQRVRIEWPNGDAVEGILTPRTTGAGYRLTARGGGEFWPEDTRVDDRTVTILAGPRPEEPMRLGAVATASNVSGRLVRIEPVAAGDAYVWVDRDACCHSWESLRDPVVLHYGWDGGVDAEILGADS